MDIKQEPDDLIGDQNWELVLIKQEKDENPPTKYEYASEINQLIDGEDEKCNLVQTNNTKKDGKSMKKRNPRGRIFLCIVCGYMCKKKVEFCCHLSSNHFFYPKNLFRTKRNTKYKNKIRSQITYRGISLDAEVKDEIEVVNHELKEEFKNIDLKLCTNEIALIDRMCYCSKTIDNPIKCEICFKYAQQRQSTNSFCQINGKLLESEYCSNNHLRAFTGEKPYNVRTQSFSRKGHLKKHLRGNTVEKPFKCNICAKSFSHKGNFNLHLRTHSGEKPFKCNVCTKYFSRKSSLNRHLRIHICEKPFKCNVCTTSFSSKGSLKLHVRTHTGEKTFVCNVCTKSFSLKGSLKHHMRTHTGEKPFKCSICTTFFSQKGSLNRHLRIHNDEKPFECNVCTKYFSRKSSLNRHLSTHTGEIQM